MRTDTASDESTISDGVDERPGQEPFEPPTLTVLGSVQELTQIKTGCEPEMTGFAFTSLCN